MIFLRKPSLPITKYMYMYVYNLSLRLCSYSSLIFPPPPLLNTLTRKIVCLQSKRIIKAVPVTGREGP
jgi:hypothetical protein